MDQEQKEKLQQSFRDEKKKLSGMTWMERFDYLWTYYKIWLLVLAGVVFIIYLIGTIIYRSTFDTALGIAVINDSSYSSERMEPWKEELHEELELGPKEEINLEYNLSISFSEMASELEYASMAKISALIASKSIDVMIMDESAAKNYAASNAFKDLSEYLPAELYSMLEEEGMITSFAGESGEELPCLIRLNAGRMEALAGIQMNPVYLGVMNNSERQERTLEFIEYLLGNTVSYSNKNEEKGAQQ